MDIDDVNGISDYADDGDAVAKTYGGISTFIEGDMKPTAWDDLRIENCTLQSPTCWLQRPHHRADKPDRWRQHHSNFQRCHPNANLQQHDLHCLTTRNTRESDPPRIIYHKSWNKGWSDDCLFANNIFINHCKEAVYVRGDSKNNRYHNNLFFGEHPDSEPADPHKLVADPLLVGPGAAGEGIASARCAYSLRPRSPEIFAGRALPRHARRDFAQRRVIVMNGRVDVGALTWRPGQQSGIRE